MFDWMKRGLAVLILTAGITGCASTGDASSSGLQQVEVGGETQLRGSYRD